MNLTLHSIQILNKYVNLYYLNLIKMYILIQDFILTSHVIFLN